MTKNGRIYLGLNGDSNTREIFRSLDTPSASKYPQYHAVIGPFRTMRGTIFMRDCGVNNPHIQRVSDAELLAKINAKRRKE